MSDLLVIVPSRGRPGNVAELLEAWHQTAASSGRTRLLIAVDDDDPELSGYRALPLPGWAELAVGPRERMNPTLNRRALECAGDHYALGFMGDDHRPRTRCWDDAVLGALRAMGSGLAYGDDLVQRERLATAVFITSDIVRALGYFAPPRQMHMYLDNAWMTLGTMLGRLAYLPNVVIEHLHPVAGTAEWDDGYREVNAQVVYDSDRAAFEAWLREDLEAAVERVEEAIGVCA